MKYNNSIQFYKDVPIRLIVYTDKLNAKRFILGDMKSKQNIWIPNCYLKPDGTLKANINIDFIFKKAYQQGKFSYANININPMLW